MTDGLCGISSKIPVVFRRFFPTKIELAFNRNYVALIYLLFLYMVSWLIAYMICLQRGQVEE
jgi:hypothetical protein